MNLVRRLSAVDAMALMLCLLAGLASAWVSTRVFEGVAHIEDEFAFVWQAQTIARGRLTIPSPEHAQDFLIPFVVDYKGRRFGKYPLGWPVVLSFGVRFGARHLVNPFLAVLGIWLTYRLGKRLIGSRAGLLAAFLTVTSPFFLMNAGSLLSHPLGLVLSAAFALAWLDAFGPESNREPGYLPILTAGGALGVLALTRPLTAIGVALPFGVHGLYLLLRASPDVRRRLIVFGVIAASLSSLHLVWQYALTGDPFLNPYTLWWPYDKVGFGPGIGVIEGGHNLQLARMNTRFSLSVGYRDLFGWGRYSWIFLPAGLWAVRRNRGMLLVSSVLLSLVLIYNLYWIGAWVLGPRYYYEGLYSATLLTSAGIFYLAGWPLQDGEPWPNSAGLARVRPLFVTGLAAFLVALNLVFYTPMRIGGLRGLYGIERARVDPFLTDEAQALTPALVIVHPSHWTEYGALLELEDPFLQTPFIFTFSRGRRLDELIAESFPERRVFHYYPDEPYRFYVAPRSAR